MSEPRVSISETSQRSKGGCGQLDSTMAKMMATGKRQCALAPTQPALALGSWLLGPSLCFSRRHQNTRSDRGSEEHRRLPETKISAKGRGREMPNIAIPISHIIPSNPFNGG